MLLTDILLLHPLPQRNKNPFFLKSFRLSLLWMLPRRSQLPQIALGSPSPPLQPLRPGPPGLESLRNLCLPLHSNRFLLHFPTLFFPIKTTPPRRRMKEWTVKSPKSQIPTFTTDWTSMVLSFPIASSSNASSLFLQIEIYLLRRSEDHCAFRKRWGVEIRSPWTIVRLSFPLDCQSLLGNSFQCD